MIKLSFEKDGSGSKIFAFLWLGSGQPFKVCVRLWKTSPKNAKFFNFLPFRSKKSLRVGSKSTRVKVRSASYLLQVKSKPRSGPISSFESCKNTSNNEFTCLYSIQKSKCNKQIQKYLCLHTPLVYFH